ncbi:MAG: hypothetical protein NWE96_11890 [Candidatus Bathyarchaeota archaeon]|nr:hypothetical protein [Candidatus Bathyarchaeota archaeon]
MYDVLKTILLVDDKDAHSGQLDPIPIALGQTVKLTIDYQPKPNEDLRIRIVTIEGTFMESSGKSGQTATQQVSVSFAKDPTTATSTINPSSSQSYYVGSVISVSAQLASDEILTSWTSSTSSLQIYSDQATSTLVKVNGAGTITAHFAKSNQPYLEFTSGASQEVTVNELSNPITIKRQQDSTTGPITVTLTASISTGTFQDAQGNPISTVNIANAGGTATFYFKDSVPGTNTITVSSPGYTPDQTQFTIKSKTAPTPTTSTGPNPTTSTSPDPSTSTSPNPTPNQATNKLTFVAGAPQNVQINTPSEKITVQRQDSAGTPITTGTTSVTLTATAGTFYSNAECTNAITNPVTISSGASTTDFYYKCPTSGQQTLTASATNYQSATTTFTLSTQAPTTYTVTYTVNNVDYGTVSPSGTISNYAYGQQVTITATPKTGYQFVDWTRSGNIIITDETSQQTTATIQGDGTITANFKAQSTDKLVFTTGTKQYLQLNQVSNVITVQRQTQSGAAITSGTTTIQLVSTSTGGKFYSNSDGTTEITTVTINAGASTATFYYKDTGTGTPILTASAQNYATASTYFNVNTRCTGFETYGSVTWTYGWSVGSQPPWYRGVGVGVDGTDCAKSDSNNYYNDNGDIRNGTNDGPFTCNSLNATSANTITITFQYKLENTDAISDFVLAYANVSNPNLYDTYFSHRTFTYFATLGTTQNDGQWHTYSVTFTRAANPSLFTSTFWFRFESNLDTHQGSGLVEAVSVDNVIISLS